jgi:hypothetical protein
MPNSADTAMPATSANTASSYEGAIQHVKGILSPGEEYFFPETRCSPGQGEEGLYDGILPRGFFEDCLTSCQPKG